MGGEPGDHGVERDTVRRELTEGRQRADRAHARERVERDRRAALARELTTAFWQTGRSIPAALRSIDALVSLKRLPARTLAQRAVRDFVDRSLMGNDEEALAEFGAAANLLAGGDPGSMSFSELEQRLSDPPRQLRRKDGREYRKEETNLSLAFDLWLPNQIARRAGLAWVRGAFVASSPTPTSPGVSSDGDSGRRWTPKPLDRNSTAEPDDVAGTSATQFKGLGRRARSLPALLPEDELDVRAMALCAKGLSLAKIAEELGIDRRNFYRAKSKGGGLDSDRWRCLAAAVESVKLAKAGRQDRSARHAEDARTKRELAAFTPDMCPDCRRIREPDEGTCFCGLPWPPRG